MNKVTGAWKRSGNRVISLALWLACAASGAMADWTYINGSIRHGYGWELEVSLSGTDLTITGLNKQPGFPRPLPLDEPISGGYRIVEIADYAFLECDRISAVVVPEGVTRIGYAAFSECYELVSAVFPNTLQELGGEAFYFCYQLTEVKLGEGLTSIGAAAFFNCDGLETIVLPRTVASLGQSAFNNCETLARVYFAGDKPATVDLTFERCEATVYYLPGRTGWGSTFEGRPAVLWNPEFEKITVNDAGTVSCTVTGTKNIPIFVEACSDLDGGIWTPLGTLTTLGSSGTHTFTDAASTRRFYRIVGK